MVSWHIHTIPFTDHYAAVGLVVFSVSIAYLLWEIATNILMTAEDARSSKKLKEENGSSRIEGSQKGGLPNAQREGDTLVEMRRVKGVKSVSSMYRARAT